VSLAEAEQNVSVLVDRAISDAFAVYPGAAEWIVREYKLSDVDFDARFVLELMEEAGTPRLTIETARRFLFKKVDDILGALGTRKILTRLERLSLSSVLSRTVRADDSEILDTLTLVEGALQASEEASRQLVAANIGDGKQRDDSAARAALTGEDGVDSEDDDTPLVDIRDQNESDGPPSGDEAVDSTKPRRGPKAFPVNRAMLVPGDVVKVLPGDLSDVVGSQAEAQGMALGFLLSLTQDNARGNENQARRLFSGLLYNWMLTARTRTLEKLTTPVRVIEVDLPRPGNDYVVPQVLKGNDEVPEVKFPAFKTDDPDSDRAFRLKRALTALWFYDRTCFGMPTADPVGIFGQGVIIPEIGMTPRVMLLYHHQAGYRGVDRVLVLAADYVKGGEDIETKSNAFRDVLSTCTLNLHAM
jgi:hypothetical protein